jgi:hypothetical protein
MGVGRRAVITGTMKVNISSIGIGINPNPDTTIKAKVKSTATPNKINDSITVVFKVNNYL